MLQYGVAPGSGYSRRLPIVQVRVACRGLSVRTQCQQTDELQIQNVKKGRQLVKAEIPAFIQRPDMLKQLYRWATIDIATEGATNFGLPCAVKPVNKGDITWGFLVQLLKDGEPQGELLISFDEEIAKKYKYIARTKEGWPSTDDVPFDEVEGKCLEIWRVGDEALPASLKQPTDAIVKALAEAVDRYYAFGSVFSEEL